MSVVGVRRVMGIETEYGISVPGRPHANPMLLSGRVVQAYAAASGRRTHQAGWDYSDETPLADARGFSMSRGGAHPSQLTDEAWTDPTVANVVLTNGARLYVDHAHPEYSSPEVLSPREGLIWDRAGEHIMAAAAAHLASEDAAEAAARGSDMASEAGSEAGSPTVVNLYKNNADGKGQSYGTHENYLLSRQTPFDRIVAGLTPFFVARQILCGAGRVGIGQSSQEAGYQLSSRADFFEAEVGLETTFRRPIINTRDEPHATAERYRRLHVIIGDANLCDVAGLLKLGTTSLVLGAIEADAVPSQLRLARPLWALREISHDPGLTALVELDDGRRLTGLDLLWAYYEVVRGHLSRDNATGTLDGLDDDTVEVLLTWEDVLTRLTADPASCGAEIDWIAKQAVLEGYRERDGLAWTDPRLAAVDIQWSDVRPEKSLARRLESRGRIERLVAEDDVLAARGNAPESTRAYFRGECIRRYGDAVAAASWDSVIVDVPGQDSLQRIGTAEPLRGTRRLVGDLLDRCPDVAALYRELTAPAT